MYASALGGMSWLCGWGTKITRFFLGGGRVQNSVLSTKVKELDTARAASEDLILSLSAEKTRMLGSSGEASDTIESLVDEYSRLVSQCRDVSH